MVEETVAVSEVEGPLHLGIELSPAEALEVDAAAIDRFEEVGLLDEVVRLEPEHVVGTA